jgi:hypothetical protein
MSARQGIESISPAGDRAYLTETTHPWCRLGREALSPKSGIDLTSCRPVDTGCG